MKRWEGWKRTTKGDCRLGAVTTVKGSKASQSQPQDPHKMKLKLKVRIEVCIVLAYYGTQPSARCPSPCRRSFVCVVPLIFVNQRGGMFRVPFHTHKLFPSPRCFNYNHPVPLALGHKSLSSSRRSIARRARIIHPEIKGLKGLGNPPLLFLNCSGVSVGYFFCLYIVYTIANSMRNSYIEQPGPTKPTDR